MIDTNTLLIVLLLASAGLLFLLSRIASRKTSSQDPQPLREAVEDPRIEPREPAPMHWPPCGEYSVETVGESFYRDAIADIARNKNGERALVYCTASLVLENENPHDSEAVAVHVAGRKVAHLSREMARDYRARLRKDALDLPVSTCDAVIHGGGASRGRTLDYCVELDLDLAGPPPNTEPPRRTTPVRRAHRVIVSKVSPTEYELAVPFMDRQSLALCSDGCELDPWTRDDIDEIHFFAPRSVGGSGRVAVISKADAPEIALNLDAVVATVLRVSGRSCLVKCEIPSDPALPR